MEGTWISPHCVWNCSFVLNMSEFLGPIKRCRSGEAGSRVSYANRPGSGSTCFTLLPLKYWETGEGTRVERVPHTPGEWDGNRRQEHTKPGRQEGSTHQIIHELSPGGHRSTTGSPRRFARSQIRRFSAVGRFVFPAFWMPQQNNKTERRFVCTQGPSPTKPSFWAEPTGSVRNHGGRRVGALLSEPTGSLPAADFQFLMTEIISWVFWVRKPAKPPAWRHARRF